MLKTGELRMTNYNDILHRFSFYRRYAFETFFGGGPGFALVSFGIRRIIEARSRRDFQDDPI